ncbi:MAG TPA: magnesium transporter [Vicinamibacterales bacterium]|nr:magnesium transporter [Vicinamibacterales bacterium]
MTDAARLDELALPHATTTFARLRPEDTVDEALGSIPEQALDTAITYFYVVDAGGSLRGVVPTRRLLTAARDTRVAELMTDASVTLPMTATLRDAAALLQRHRLLAAPIVGRLGRIHGVVDATMLGLDVADGLTPARADEWFQLAGVRTEGTAGGIRPRLGSLLWNVGGGLVAAAVAGFHEHLLAAAAGLALFMPVTLALSESVGMQAVALALTDPRGRSNRGAARAAFAELRSAPALGVACALLVGLAVIAWQASYALTATVTIAIAVAMTASAVVGAVVPRLMHRFHANATVAAGPVVLAVADFVSLLVYFRIAAVLL